MQDKKRSKADEVVDVWKELQQSSSDVLGSYTGASSINHEDKGKPVQDADDL